MTEKIKQRIIEINPRRFGKLQEGLLKFYQWCKEKKSAVFAMPEGNIYSQKAHDQILKELRKDIKQEILGKLPRYWVKPDTHDFHDGFNQALTEIKKIINE